MCYFMPLSSSFSLAHCRIVYADEETGAYYDVLLSKIDVRWGIYGLNVFYKLQVDLWLFFPLKLMSFNCHAIDFLPRRSCPSAVVITCIRVPYSKRALGKPRYVDERS